LQHQNSGSMKHLIVFIMTLSSTVALAQNGKATTIKKTFNRTTTVSIKIDADAATVWRILTDAPGYPIWNSTIVSLKGKIAEGEKIELTSTLDPERTFKLKVKEMQENEMMVWGDAMGKRTYTLTKEGNGVVFTMSEKIGGNPMFPLFANKIPSFDESFETFAADLKKKAESSK